MKVIDLLNEIANGEELPETIKYRSGIYHKYNHCGYYYAKSWEEETLLDNIEVTSDLTEEIEIIEDKPMLVWDEEDKVVEVNVRPNLTYKFSADGLTITSVEEPKEIEEIDRVNGSYLVDLRSDSSIAEQSEAITSLVMYLNNNADKLNELIKAVNELKKGK